MIAVTRENRLQEVKKEIHSKKNIEVLSRCDVKTLKKMRDSFSKCASDNDVKFSEEINQQLSLIQDELGFEKSELSEMELATVRRKLMRDFIVNYYENSIRADELQNKVDFALNNLSDNSICAIRKVTFIKSKGIPNYQLQDFVSDMKIKISDYVSGQNFELENQLSDDILQEIKMAFEPLNKPKIND